MEAEWNNTVRFNTIHEALGNLPHDQTPMGIGFRLRHDPTKCRRCRANIAVLELDGIIRAMESYFEATSDEVEIDT